MNRKEAAEWNFRSRKNCSLNESLSYETTRLRYRLKKLTKVLALTSTERLKASEDPMHHDGFGRDTTRRGRASEGERFTHDQEGGRLMERREF